MKPLPEADLEHIVRHAPCLAELKGARLFITGGTGFFGCWLLQSFAYANDRLGLGAVATVLTRDADAFHQKAPHLAARRDVQLVEGDVTSFAPTDARYTHVIHAATPSTGTLGSDDPLQLLRIIAEGTLHVLQLAQACGARRFLLTSSGAVYGRQPSDLTHVSEDYAGAPDPLDPTTAYGQGKRLAEFYAGLWHNKHGLESVTARCFAFVGPCLPLDAHFAIGNFIRDGRNGGPVRVSGDGTPYRSYLYAADLAVWLWTILLRGVPGSAYNVGSENDAPIQTIANVVARAFDPPLPVTVALPASTSRPTSRYVPCTAKARQELGLDEHIALDEALRRTLAWMS